MSLEHTPARSDPTATTRMGDSARNPPDASDYWQGLIDEEAAARFLKLSPRTLQGYRYRGGGPHYVALSARCVRYRRIDLSRWAEARLRASTSDSGAEAV